MAIKIKTPQHLGKPTALLQNLIARKNAQPVTPWHQHQPFVPNETPQRSLRVKK